MGKKLNRPIHPIFLEDNYLKKNQTKREKKPQKPFSLQPVWEQSRERLLEALAGLGAAQGRQQAMPSHPCPGRADRPLAALTVGRSECTPNLHTERLAGPTLGTGSTSLAAAMEITRSRAGLQPQGSPGETRGSRRSHPIPSCLASAQPAPGTPTARPGSWEPSCTSPQTFSTSFTARALKCCFLKAQHIEMPGPGWNLARAQWEDSSGHGWAPGTPPSTLALGNAAAGP